MRPFKCLLSWLSLTVLLVISVDAPAQTVPNLLDFQGFLRTEAGQPVTKTVAMRISLYDASSGGNLLFFEDLPMVPVYGGRFSVQVGATKLIPPDLFDTHPSVFLGLIVDGSPELPRQQLLTVPFAFRSGTSSTADVAKVAKDLDCVGCVTAARLSDQSVTAAKIGEPCKEGQVLARVGEVWQCATLPTYSGKDFALSAQACLAGQKVQGIANDGTLVCGDDAWQAYTAGTGLVLESAQFSLDLSYADGRYVNAGEAGSVTGPMIVDGVVTASKLGEPCKAGEILKMLPSGWGCAPDADTRYTGADFATSGQACDAGLVVQGIGADGKLKCGPDMGTTYTAGPGLDLTDNKFSLLPGCNNGQVPKWDATAKDWRCGDDNNLQVSAGIGLKLSGTTLSADTATIQGWARDVCYDTPSELVTALSTWDQVALDDLTTSTVFGGDVSGKYDSLTIGAGKVTDAKIASVSWTKLTGIPAGFADGTDDGTTYTAGAGISIQGTTISIPTGGVANAMLANPSLTVSSGTGLTGGGTVALGGTTTLSIANTGVTPGTYKRATLTVDSQGRLTSASNGPAIDLTADVTGILPLANGGTGASSATGARVNLGAAASGVNADITGLTRLATQAAVVLLPYGTAAGSTGEIRLQELAANGTNFVGFKAPDTIAADRIWTLPSADGMAGQVLRTDGSGNLGWASVGTGSVTQVNSGAGLTGGPITTTGTLSIANGGVTNAMLANSSLTVTAGSGLSGGGTVALGASTSLSVATGGITSTHIADSVVSASVQNAAGTEQFTVTDGSPGLRFAASGSATVTFDAATHKVTISATDANSGGTVTSIGPGTPGAATGSSGLTFSANPITATGTLALSNTGVTAGTYTRATVTVDGQGRVTSAASGGAIDLSGDTTGTLPIAKGGTGATTAAGARTNLGVPATDGTGATGTWGISISGNAATATTISGTVGVTHGGTGLTSYTTGSLLYASGSTTLAGLADVATGNVLLSGGVNTAPAWGKVTMAHIQATGTPSITTFLRGDGTWAPVTSIVPQAASAPFICNATNAGASYYDTTKKQLFTCNGSRFVAIGASGDALPGTTDDTALASCEAILAANPSTPNGIYYIDPAGGGTATAYPVYCWMNNVANIDGGGWALALNVDPNDGNVHPFRDVSFWGGNNSYGSLQSALTADFKSRQVFTTDYQKLLVMVHKKGQMVGWREWYLPRSQSLYTQFSLPVMVQTNIAPYTNAGPWNSPTYSGNWGGSRGGPPLTAAMINAYNGGLDANEAIVAPNGGLRLNMNWGNDSSPDGSRVRSDTLDTVQGDDTKWGLGTQMNLQDFWNAWYTYPGCDVGSLYPWYNYFCVGTDRFNFGGGNANGQAKDLGYSYAFFVKGLPPKPDPAQIGNSAATAAQSCEDLLARRPGVPSGVYYIDPTSAAGSPNPANAYQVYCQMDIDGGGWTLAMNLDTGSGEFRGFKDGIWTGDTDIGTPALGLHGDFKSAKVFTSRFTKLMIMIHKNGTGPTATSTPPAGSTGYLGWRSWNLAGAGSLYEYFNRSPAGRWPYSNLTDGAIGASISALSGVEAVVRPAGDLRVNTVWGDGTSWDVARIRTASYCSASIGGYASSGACDADNIQWGLGTQMDCNNNSGSAGTIAGYVPGGPHYMYCDAGSINAWSNGFCFGGDKWCPACGDGINASSGSEQQLSYDYAIFVKGPVLNWDTSLVGNSSSKPGTSCAAIKSARPTAPTGLYWLTGPIQVWCDMDIDGGGWVLAMNLNTSDGAVRHWMDSAFWTTTTGYGSATNPWINDYKQSTVMGTSYSKIMIRVHNGGLDTIGWRSWNLTSSRSLNSILTQATSTSPSPVTSSILGSYTADLNAYEALVLPSGNLVANFKWGANGDYGRLANDGAPRADDKGGALGYVMNYDSNPTPAPAYYPACDASGSSWWNYYFCFGLDRTCAGNCGTGWGARATTDNHYLQDYQYDYAIYMK